MRSAHSGAQGSGRSGVRPVGIHALPNRCLSGAVHAQTASLRGYAQALQEACPQPPWSLTFSYGRALQSATLKVPAPLRA